MVIHNIIPVTGRGNVVAAILLLLALSAGPAGAGVEEGTALAQSLHETE